MVGSGLVDSLARPNGNTTGISLLATELDGKRQEILIEAVPGLCRMAALADSNNAVVAKLDALQGTARARNIELSIHRIARGNEIEAAIEDAHASGAKALNVLSSPILRFNRQLIMDRVAALRLPAIYQWPDTGGGRRLSRLRAALGSALSRRSSPTAHCTLPRHQGRRHPGRAADQVRAGDQPQDRQSAGPYGAPDITGAR